LTEREKFKEAARDRFEDAKVLFEGNRIDASFYIIGYSLECITKFIILYIYGYKQIEQHKKIKKHIDEPDDFITELNIVEKKSRNIRKMQLNNLLIKKTKILLKKFNDLDWKVEIRYNKDFKREKYINEKSSIFSDIEFLIKKLNFL